ncbi:MAG: hypothetical protein ACYDHE_17070 [Candidatus Acidiferrales bacterium]
MNLTLDQLRADAIAAGFSGAALETILAIIPHEGGYVSDAINNTAYPTLPGYHAPGAGAVPEYSVGPLQINALAHYQSSGMTFGQYVNYLRDPLNNLKEAFKISNGGLNFLPWSSYAQGLVPTAGGVTPVSSIGPIPIPNWLDPTNLPFWNSLSDTAKAIVTAIGKPFQLIGDAFSKVVDPHLWWRVLFVLSGVGMIVMGMGWMNEKAEIKLAKTVASVAGNVAAKSGAAE